MSTIYCIVLTGLLIVIPAIGMAIQIDLDHASVPADAFTLDVISVAAESKQQARIYIYHTHTYEAYKMDDLNIYTPTETWRTADMRCNVVRIGAELAQALRTAGFDVTHDTTAYEPPKLSTAYGRSMEGLKKAAAEGYDLYIDLHRDSYSKGNGANTVSDGKNQMGRFLFLIGQGTGTGFDERPNWQENQRAAKMISDALNRQVKDLSRGVALKSGRYNQQAATPCILIEAGNNENTLPEMLATIPYLTHAICAYFDGQ